MHEWSHIPLRRREFLDICSLLYERFGIHYDTPKQSLICDRLQKVLRRHEMASFADYVEYLRRDASGRALLELADVMSTNYTYFFREDDHFEFLQKKILPALQTRRDRKLRIWSAGCSSGEEVYTLAMVVAEFLGEEASRWDVKILGSDISQSVLSQAEQGVYTDAQVQKLSKLQRARYFSRVDTENWQVSEELRRLTVFRKLNLMHSPYPFKGRFDLIFCRNVMIYFSQEVIRGLLEKFHHYLQEEGHLFIGHSESLDKRELFQPVQPAIYQKWTGRRREA